jgi:predicted ATP-dependent serine protease
MSIHNRAADDVIPKMDRDVHNFSSSSSHRLPTVSASAALLKLTSGQTKAVSTGLPHLDQILYGKTPGVSGAGSGGFSRGQVIEVYGPPGVGKTTLG